MSKLHNYLHYILISCAINTLPSSNLWQNHNFQQNDEMEILELCTNVSYCSLQMLDCTRYVQPLTFACTHFKVQTNTHASARVSIAGLCCLLFHETVNIPCREIIALSTTISFNTRDKRKYKGIVYPVCTLDIAFGLCILMGPQLWFKHKYGPNSDQRHIRYCE